MECPNFHLHPEIGACYNFKDPSYHDSRDSRVTIVVYPEIIDGKIVWRCNRECVNSTCKLKV